MPSTLPRATKKLRRDQITGLSGPNLTLGFLSGLDKQNQEENGGD
ncbi:hypothetical protein MYAER_3899 [Microcystis aeruginosa NIES-2549]|uniref:Uncharacterized protein n=1 Tax=Microcystis aeruginosa NIES-2549 TaxID=1641812 RepID=A0A0F6U7C4_MICAE|nr:hypothetical protein MYAER_3899 [Microcystis aeruginosa NIES-2549]AOC54638.1 hypothetical protein amyaer_3945 [Microcystis aeruginosa NIES-2481]